MVDRLSRLLAVTEKSALALRRFLIVVLLLPGLQFANAAEGMAQPVGDPVVEARVNKLAEELRCLTCMGQSIADSQSSFSNDMKREIRSMIVAGKNDKEIMDFMVQRYGDFVLYRPPVKGSTALLWFGPAVLLVVGVNGTGKTTTTGKLGRLLVAEGRTVVLGAADTFRAAAADQLQTWGDRVGAAVVRGPEGGDPAAVAFDAVRIGAEADVDTVVIDTAGRLHTKVGLMDELGKVKRVIEKQGPVDEVLLVLDATTGQNGLTQAKVFSEVVDVTGIVLTKLDGTAKGGIVVAVQRELGVPVKLVGLGEGPDDLAPFDPVEFVDALLEE